MIALSRSSFTLRLVPAGIAVLAVALTAVPVSALAQAPAVASPAPPPDADAIPLRLALALESASGVVTGPFLNQLLGVRLDGRFSEHLSLGVYLGAANLKGKDGRAHSALTYAALEYMAGDPALKVRFPLRFATGWLAANGPVARAAAGMAFAAGRKVDLIGEVASMVWLTNNQNLLSIDLSLEIAYRF
jgi:hypothetical protein